MVASAACVCAILAALGLVHLYWALGGRRGKAGAIPSAGGKPNFSPAPGMTALVGLALWAMAALVAAAAGLIAAPVPSGWLRAGCGLLAAVFLARAIGDFRYVGFFKRVKGSVFARRDTRAYSPLCVLLAFLTGFVAAG